LVRRDFRYSAWRHLGRAVHRQKRKTNYSVGEAISYQMIATGFWQNRSGAAIVGRGAATAGSKLGGIRFDC
jgi:hypothetical protein